MQSFRFLPPALLLALAACTASAPEPRPVSAGSRAAPRAVRSATPAPIIGQESAAIIAALGTPAIDAREGPARKLQFRGACVLDVYLYPPASGIAPRATYAEARTPAGNDTDRAACIAALERR